MKPTTHKAAKYRQQHYLRSFIAFFLCKGFAFGLLSTLASPALAAGTNAGVTIDNTAHGSFENPSDPGNAIPVNSNTVTLTVAEIAGIDVTGTGATEAPFGVTNAGPGQGDGAISSDDVVYFTYTITNIGNDQTQFFIPGAPANVINGTFDAVATGPIEIIEYNDGTTATPLSIAVPATGDTTGNLIPAAQNGGSVPEDGCITVRVPIKADSGLAVATDTITVVLGNTIDAASQNFPEANGGEFGTPTNRTDVFTVDTTGTANSDASAVNPDPEREASDVIVTPLGTPSVDYGDAPDAAAGTTPAPDATTPADYETVPGRGPSHVVDGTTFLGTGVDVDTGAFNDPAPEDDGVEQGGNPLAGQTFVAGQTYTLDVDTSLATTGFLNGWIDFNRDGNFDAGEQVAVDQQPTGNTITVTASVPFSASAGTTFARFRYSTVGGLSPTDAAPDGEVEDYQITINAAAPALRLVKRITRIEREVNPAHHSPGGPARVVDFTAFVDDTGTDDNSPNWPSPVSRTPYLQGEIAAPAEPGELVDYTVYFLSDGNTPINNIQVCDYIPANTSYVAGSLVMNLNDTGDVTLSDSTGNDEGENFALSGAPSATCPAAGDTTGGIFVHIANPADAPAPSADPFAPGDFGYIQFTVRVD